MAKYTKVSEGGQVEFDFEFMAQEVSAEFVKEVSNAMRKTSSVVVSQDTESNIFKEVIVQDGIYITIIQAVKVLAPIGWKVYKVTMSKYDIKDLYQKIWEGEKCHD